MSYFDGRLKVPTKVISSFVLHCTCPHCQERNSVLQINCRKGNKPYVVYRCLKCVNYIKESELKSSGSRNSRDSRSQPSSKRQEVCEAVARIKAKRKRRAFPRLGR